MTTRQERIGFILKHAEAPQHYGPLPDPSITVKGGGGECGESITLYVRVGDENRITEASFEADGTTIGKAAASLTTDTIIGKTLEEVLEISPNVIVDTLGRDIVGYRLRAATVTLDTAKAAARRFLGLERQGIL